MSGCMRRASSSRWKLRCAAVLECSMTSAARSSCACVLQCSCGLFGAVTVVCCESARGGWAGAADAGPGLTRRLSDTLARETVTETVSERVETRHSTAAMFSSWTTTSGM